MDANEQQAQLQADRQTQQQNARLLWLLCLTFFYLDAISNSATQSSKQKLRGSTDTPTSESNLKFQSINTSFLAHAAYPAGQLVIPLPNITGTFFRPPATSAKHRVYDGVVLNVNIISMNEFVDVPEFYHVYGVLNAVNDILDTTSTYSIPFQGFYFQSKLVAMSTRYRSQAVYLKYTSNRSKNNKDDKADERESLLSTTLSSNNSSIIPPTRLVDQDTNRLDSMKPPILDASTPKPRLMGQGGYRAKQRGRPRRKLTSAKQTDISPAKAHSSTTLYAAVAAATTTTTTTPSPPRIPRRQCVSLFPTIDFIVTTENVTGLSSSSTSTGDEESVYIPIGMRAPPEAFISALKNKSYLEWSDNSTTLSSASLAAMQKQLNATLNPPFGLGYSDAGVLAKAADALLDKYLHAPLLMHITILTPVRTTSPSSSTSASSSSSSSFSAAKSTNR